MRRRAFFLFFAFLSCAHPKSTTPPKEPTPQKETPKEAYQASQTSLPLLPGVLVDSEKGVLYAMRQGDEISAIELKSGRLLWTSKEGQKPLLVSNESLLAQKGASLVVLHANTGRLLRQCTSPVSMPGIDEGLGYRGFSSGGVYGGEAYVFWSWNTWYSGGAAPSPEMEEAARKSGSGSLLVDLEGCSAKAATKSLPAPEAPLRRRPDGQIELTLEDGTSKLIPLSKDAIVAHPAASGDLRYAMLTEQLSGPMIQYRTQLLSLSDASVVATLKLSKVPTTFFVWGDSLITDTYSRVIEAVDIRDGKALWSYELRDTSYRGPYPP